MCAECLFLALPLGQIFGAISPCHRVSEWAPGKSLTPSGIGSNSFAPFGGCCSGISERASVVVTLPPGCWYFLLPKL